MPQPTPYTRSFSYTDFSASYPTLPHPGAAIDVDLNAIAQTLVGVLSSLALVQRDDGALKNQVVTLDSLSPAVMLALGAGVIWLPRGAWATATAYNVSDVVTNGTGSYVCSAAHTASALFATDLAAGKWILLFDTAGVTPGDGTVTAAKLGAGAVTTPAIGFTGLDLSGSIRGRTGLQAGTAPVGGLLHAKNAAGDAIAKVERTTDAQGAVGYRVIGVTVTWEMSQPSGADELQVLRNGARAAAFTDDAGLDVSGPLRAVAGIHPTTSVGVGMSYVAGVGYVTAYDYDASAWKQLKLRGSTVTLTASGVDVLAVSATGVDITGTMSRGGVELGWLDAPQNYENGAYTLALGDRGKHIYSNNTTGQTIVVPTNMAVPFPIGATVTIVNEGLNPINLSTSGINVRFAGTSLFGDRVISTHGVATLLKVGTDNWFISGAGIS